MTKIRKFAAFTLIAGMIFSATVTLLYADKESDLVKYTVGKFKDVKSSDWYAEAVGKLSVMDIVNGLGDGSFNPQGEVTRAQFVKMLVQAMEYKKIDSVSFVDMRANAQAKAHWASVYVETALRNGVIIKSEEANRFYPYVPISREDMVMMICRALKLEPSTGTNPYFDLAEPNSYFTKAYEEYLVRGIPVGNKVAFNPTGVTTRAQAAVIISRLVEYKENPKAFVEKMAREERVANGTATKADLEAVRQEEIAKAKADPNYIMEPIITVEYNTDPWTYEYFTLYFENMVDYSDNSKWKLEVANYKQLNSFEIPCPDGTFVKREITNWRPLGSIYKGEVRSGSYILGKNYYTTQALIKDFPISAGMKIEFKITVKNGPKERVMYKTVVVNNIKFKG